MSETIVSHKLSILLDFVDSEYYVRVGIIQKKGVSL